MDFELSDEFEVKVWMHQGSVLSPFLFAVVVNVITEFVRGEMLHADDIVLMSKTIDCLRNKLMKWM